MEIQNSVIPYVSLWYQGFRSKISSSDSFMFYFKALQYLGFKWQNGTMISTFNDIPGNHKRGISAP